jgi:hypothetical protein
MDPTLRAGDLHKQSRACMCLPYQERPKMTP